MNYKAWVTKAAKQPMVLETVDLGSLGAEEVEVAVEHCGLCHSDLSVFNNEWGISQYPAILGHEVVGRITAVGSNAKGVKVGQRVGVGWYAGSCMHCHQCMSGSHHLCPQVQATIVGHRGGFATTSARRPLPPPRRADRSVGSGPLGPTRDEAVLRAFAERYFPDGAGPTVMLKACMFTNSPDEHFLLGTMPDAPQVSLFAGESGHGYKFASVVGEILADLAVDGVTRHDIGLFELDRFAAGLPTAGHPEHVA